MSTGQQDSSEPINDDHSNIVNDLDLEITSEEILNVVKALTTQKSPGLDGLISEIFRSSLDIIYPLLVKIFNVFFSSGCIRNHGPRESLLPYIKIEGFDEVNNYRGITLINIMSKIYSHILQSRLIKWAEQCEKIHICQFGFQPQKSTVDCFFLFIVSYQKLLSVVKIYIVLL